MSRNKIITGLYAYFAEKLGGPDAPDPKEIADMIGDLIATPAGKRPLRVVVGNVGTRSLHEFNRATDKFQ